MSLTALIIDDEPLARQELQYLLERAGGVEVLAQGTNGIEAVELIREHKPDVVFLDVQMPGLDGFAVLKKLLDKKMELPQGVFATAFAQCAWRGCWGAHRSFVVNIQHIREVVPWFKSSYQLRMDDAKKTEIPVSRAQTKRLRELFNL